VAAAHPEFTIAQAGDASFQRAYDDTQGKDFQRARRIPSRELTSWNSWGAR
jgi:hypothetical protein